MVKKNQNQEKEDKCQKIKSEIDQHLQLLLNTDSWLINLKKMVQLIIEYLLCKKNPNSIYTYTNLLEDYKKFIEEKKKLNNILDTTVLETFTKLASQHPSLQVSSQSTINIQLR